MTDGKVATLDVQHKTVRAPGHEAVMYTMKMKTSQGVLRAGLVVAKDSNEEGVPYDAVTETLGTGNGSDTDFTGTVTGGRLEPGSVSVTDGVETFEDDGIGNLIGDAGGSGTVIYRSGKISVSFDAAVGNGTDVDAAAGKEIAGVLDRDVDTDKSNPGIVIVHGAVKEAELTKGAANAACAAADFKRLGARGIYPV